jgi:hypothetical protein
VDPEVGGSSPPNCTISAKSDLHERAEVSLAAPRALVRLPAYRRHANGAAQEGVMIDRFVLVGLVMFAFGAMTVADAQERTRVRGTIEKVEGNVLTVKTREGPVVAIKLAENYGVGGLVPAKFEDIKQNTYVGIAGLPQPDGKVRALEVLIFPEAMRGTAEGHFPWDLVPESTMTNAAVTDTVARTEGNTLVLKYKDGEKTIVVPAGAPVVRAVPAEKGELKAGAKIFIAAAVKGADGSLTAQRVTIGLNGLTPPM